MKIAYVLPDPGIPVGGTKGASVHVAELTAAYVRAGHEVLLVAMRAAAPAPDGVQLEVLDPGPLPHGPQHDTLRVAAAERFFECALDLLAAFRPDLVHERLSAFAGGGAALAAALGARRLVEVNAPVIDERAGRIGVADREAGERLERAALSGARAVTVSAPLAAWARERGAAHVRVVPNGVDVARFAPDPAASTAARASLGLAGAEVVGFFGSLKPWHGVDVLLDAAATLVGRRSRLHVLIVGDGPERAALEAQATGVLAGRVHFLGAVPAAAVPAYVGAFDVAAAPYREAATELGFYFSPLKVVEAMAAARPVVASRFAPIEDLLAGHGHLVPPGDVPALATAIEAVLDDPQAPALAEAARERAIRSYGWGAVVRRTLGATLEPEPGAADPFEPGSEALTAQPLAGVAA